MPDATNGSMWVRVESILPQSSTEFQRYPIPSNCRMSRVQENSVTRNMPCDASNRRRNISRNIHDLAITQLVGGYKTRLPWQPSDNWNKIGVNLLICISNCALNQQNRAPA